MFNPMYEYKYCFEGVHNMISTIINNELSKRERLYAGDLSAELFDGRLLNISYQGKLILLEIHFALRDCNWGTIPYVINNCIVRQKEQEFSIEFDATHNKDEFAFKWHGSIIGKKNSSITFKFVGTADSNFLKNRLGFCALHPAYLGGKACDVIHSDNTLERSIFPYFIAPTQPFFDIKTLKYMVNDNIMARLDFYGDVFEMEDQRNWTDHSFKTYCTPLSNPFPVEVNRNDTFEQRIRITGREVAKRNASNDNNVLDNTYTGKNKCNFGGCIKKPLTSYQIDKIKKLNLGHVRYEYRFKGDYQELYVILNQLKEINTKLLLVLFCPNEWDKELDHIKTLIGAHIDYIYGILIYPEQGNVLESTRLTSIVNELSRLNIPIGSGTDAFFTQINRERIKEKVDFIAYSNNPQVHAFNNETIMSTIEGQQANVISCREIYAGIPVFVSPITMKMRWNPDATSIINRAPGEVPETIDIRQTSLFLASWTFRSAAMFIKEQIKGATYFELIGPRGLMEDEVCERDYSFPSTPNLIYPVYYVIEFINYLYNAHVQVDIEQYFTKIKWRKGTKQGLAIANNTKFDLVLKESFDKEGYAVLFDDELVNQLGENKNIIWDKLDVHSRQKLKAYSVLYIEYSKER